MNRVARIADRVVPLVIAVNGGAAAWPFGGAVVAVIAFAAIWFLAILMVRAVTRRPGAARVYRVALVAYVALVAWAVIGDQRLEPAAPAAIAGVSAMDETTPFSAGFGSAEFAAVAHATVAGFGGPPRRLAFPAFGGFGPVGRVTQALMGQRNGEGAARVPMLREPDRPSGGSGARAMVMIPVTGPPLAIVRLDLVTSDRDLADAILRRVARHGFRAETLIVAATHTHSSPAGFSRERASEIIGTDHFHAQMFDAIVDAAAEAVEAAVANAAPATIALLRSYDRDAAGRPVLARNRAGDPVDIDDRIYALRLTDRRSGEILGMVVNYAFHPTVIGRDHLGLHRDAAGWFEDAVSAALPGRPPVLFVNGATGDITIRGGSDRAIAGIETIADGLATAAPESVGDTVRIRAARVARGLGSPAFRTVLGSRAVFLEDAGAVGDPADVGSVAGAVIAAPANVLLWALGLSEVRLTARLDATPYLGVVASLKRFVGSRPPEFGAVVLDWGTDTATAVAMLWLPGEPVSALGRRWRATMAEAYGIDDTLVIGLANGSIAYVADRDRMRGGGYEADSTLFGPDTAEHVGEALDTAVAAIMPTGRGSQSRPVAPAAAGVANADGPGETWRRQQATP